jgi:hypothetical protein
VRVTCAWLSGGNKKKDNPKTTIEILALLLIIVLSFACNVFIRVKKTKDKSYCILTLVPLHNVHYLNVFIKK